MKSLNLAPLARFNTPPVPGTTSTNPGCIDPASQSFAPAPTDQSNSRFPCSSPTVTSNGEMQRGNQHLGNAINGTVQVSSGSAAVVQASGEGGQWLDKQETVKAVATGRGPIVDVAAGSGHPGGLARNVNIR
jgi:hypothetical protein